MIIKEGLTYDDVLLEPHYSAIVSRGDIDISVKIGDIKYSNPIIPANMKTVMGFEMASKIIDSGGLAIMHRFLSIEEQLKIIKQIIEKYGSSHIAVSVGVKNEDEENLSKFIDLGVKIICIDIAHGDSLACLRMVEEVKRISKDILLIAGNVATADGASRLWCAGADIVKVGIGPGSLCTTRIETGNGVPQLTALMEIHNVRLSRRECNKGKYIIADGGIKAAGDIVKALCFADMVMAGNLFAGCDEAPGNVISIDGHKYKEYVGSSTHKTNHIEGVAAMVPYKGPYNNIMTKLTEGLRSGMSYQGASNLSDLKDNPTFIRITSAGLKESHPHDIFLK
jgi:IMP dehydrogenase